ncbi:MAG: protein kinase [Planctomyces sp.]|nr:protein kinase [Planctomyces sp.]
MSNDSEIDAGDSLGPIPSLPGVGAPVRGSISITDLRVGQIILDFQIQEVLGRGAFGTVYLALQLSLNRFVALKAGRDVGAEGRTMARLQHPNIVQVFAEQVLPDQPIRLLCMQFVPGPSLQKVLDELIGAEINVGWNGHELLKVIDRNLRGPTLLDLREVDDRRRLEELGFLECVCFIGAELAHGLQHAHRQGVMHRDIKPANILMNAYGRPLLADFNLAEDVQPTEGEAQVVGGTLAYMAPEHLEAFQNAKRSDCPEVTPRADVYSLTLLLVQLLTGSIPMPTRAASNHHAHDSGSAEGQTEADRSLERLIAFRRRPLSVEGWIPEVDRQRTPAAVSALTEVLLRGSHPEADRRTSDAKILREELLGCQRLLSIERGEDRQSLPLRFARHLPLLAFAVLALVPHAVGSFVNISYNMMRVGDLPSGSEFAPVAADTVSRAAILKAHETITMGYNVLVWPFCVVLIVLVIRANLRAIRGQREQTEAEERSSRRRLVRLPSLLAVVAAIGWLPGLFVFPAGLYLMAEVQPVAALAHFGTNLLMSGSIALSYSYVGVTWLVLYVLYPRQWKFTAGLVRDDARAEVRLLTRPLAWCRTMAGLVPLLSAVLIIAIGPSQFSSSEYAGFRVLLTLLISLGMLGYHVSSRLVERLYQRGRQYWV